MVSAWRRGFGADGSVKEDEVVLQNGSTSAIYDVLVSWAGSWGNAKADSPEYAPTLWVSMIPPGSWALALQDPGDAMDVRTGVLMEFTDGSGARWMRTARGELRPIRRSGWLDSQSGVNKPTDGLVRLDRTQP
jgi:hypothetical protein